MRLRALQQKFGFSAALAQVTGLALAGMFMFGVFVKMSTGLVDLVLALF